MESKRTAVAGPARSSHRQNSVRSSRRHSSVRPEDARAGLSVSIVGAGRLGTALGIALASTGYRVEAIVARRKSRARRASQLIPSHPLALVPASLDQLPASDLLFITTPDDLIHATAMEIASNSQSGSRFGVALHASGALSSDELRSLRDKGWSTGSMHPLIAVSDAVAGAESLRRAFFCIEGEPRAVRAARRVVRLLGGRAFSIRAEDKALYHAAAVMASGHMVALFDVATEMLVRCRLSEKEARAVLLPLVKSTLENLSGQEPARALTGTFARADVATVQRHLAAMSRARLRDALVVYTMLARRSLELAKRRGADADSIKEIVKALAAYEKNDKTSGKVKSKKP